MKWEQENIAFDLSLIGRKANKLFFEKVIQSVASVDQLGDKPKAADLVGVMKVMLRSVIVNGAIDKLIIAFNRFESTMIQRPTLMPLLPYTQNTRRKTFRSPLGLFI